MSKTRNPQFPTIVSNHIRLSIHSFLPPPSFFPTPSSNHHMKKTNFILCVASCFFVFHLFKELLENSLLTMDNTQTAPEVSFAQYFFLIDNGKQKKMEMMIDREIRTNKRIF
jgi:hypothetical protein